MNKVNLDDLIQSFENKIFDCGFEEAKENKEKVSAKKAVGYFPVYAPVEIIDAYGMLPVGLFGGGNHIEITNADSLFGSFICSIIKSTTELAITGKLDFLDLVTFQTICDSARNLCFVFKRNFSNKFHTEFIHLVQNPSSEHSIEFLASELKRIGKVFEEIANKKISDEDLKRSIDQYNKNRNLLRELYKIKKTKPHLITSFEKNILVRAGTQMPVEKHNKILQMALSEIENRNRKVRDNIKVIIEGSFCEQPPIELIQLVEECGCYIVDDDLVLGTRWYQEDIALDDTTDPFYLLANAYIKASTYSSVKHDWKKPRPQQLLEKIKRANADAVIFCIAKFCEPAFFDFVLFKQECEKNNIPYCEIEFEEKQFTFDKQRIEIETFVESLLFD